jgi:hypothetical protein
MSWSDLAHGQEKLYFKQYLMCPYLFFNITKVWTLFRDFILLFLRGKSGKNHKEIHFSRLRVRNASVVDLRMRICYQNNGG